VIDIPGTLCLLVGVVSLVLLRLLRINKVVCPVAQHSADDEWSLPMKGQHVHAFGVLDQPEHEVSFAKFMRKDLPAVIVSQLLLVERRSGQGQLTRLLEKVHAVFVGFFGLLFADYGDVEAVSPCAW
jgi:hypothetical protein